MSTAPPPPPVPPRLPVIAFVRQFGQNPTTVWTLDLQTGALHDVGPATRGAKQAALSPDGSTVVFATGGGGSDPPCFGAAGPLHTVRVDGTGLRRITFRCEVDSDPAWSPDGSRIAYVETRGGGLRVVGADGTGDTAIPDAHRYDQLTQKPLASPSFSPDGQQLSFVRYGTLDDSFGLWVTDLAGHEHRVDIRGGGRPVWGPDGTAIVYNVSPTDNPFAADLWRARPEGTDQRALTHAPYYDAKGRYFETDPVAEWSGEPRWTADGRIIFSSNRGHTGRGEHRSLLYVMDAEGKSVTELPHQLPE